MTDRIPLDAMTSDQLDTLYDELEDAAEQHARNVGNVARERETYRQAWKEAQRMRAKAEERAKQTEAAIARVRNAVHIADPEDRTDWQRGYRACAERALAALDEPSPA